MSKTYSCTLEVRGYELDSFGHVNHAVYLSYLEHARWELLAAEEITLAKFNEWKRWPVIAQVEVNYIQPTFLGDQLKIVTHVVEYGKTNFTFEQTIFRAEKPVLKAKIRAVMVNERGRPAELPDQIHRLWDTNATGSGN